MYRFSPYGSILDITGIPGPDFTLYFLVQFDPENKPQQETIVYHPNFNITKDENGVVMLNYKQKDKDLEHPLLLEIEYNKMYFCIVSHDSNKNNKLSVSFNDEYWHTTEVTMILPGYIRIGSDESSESLLYPHFHGLLGYLHFFEEAKSIHDICTAEKLCNVMSRDCSIFDTEETCKNSLDTNNNQCYYNPTCVPKLSLFANDQSVKDQCSVYDSDEACNTSALCKSVSECSNKKPHSDIHTDDSIKPIEACTFSPESESFKTLEDCIINCNATSDTNNENCNIQVCTARCRGCTSKECPWSKTIPNVPKRPLIRCFTGISENNKPAIRVMWLRPKSKEKIERYTIFLEDSNGHRDINFYFSTSDKDHLEYMLYELDKDTVYNIYMIATNSFGDSQVSNTVTIKPLDNIKLEPSNIFKEMYQLDESLQELDRAVKSGNIQTIEKAVGYADPQKDTRDVLELLSVDRLNSYTGDIKVEL